MQTRQDYATPSDFTSEYFVCLDDSVGATEPVLSGDEIIGSLQDSTNSIVVDYNEMEDGSKDIIDKICVITTKHISLLFCLGY